MIEGVIASVEDLEVMAGGGEIVAGCGDPASEPCMLEVVMELDAGDVPVESAGSKGSRATIERPSSLPLLRGACRLTLSCFDSHAVRIRLGSTW